MPEAGLTIYFAVDEMTCRKCGHERTVVHQFAEWISCPICGVPRQPEPTGVDVSIIGPELVQPFEPELENGEDLSSE